MDDLPEIKTHATADKKPALGRSATNAWNDLIAAIFALARSAGWAAIALAFLLVAFVILGLLLSF